MIRRVTPSIALLVLLCGCRPNLDEYCATKAECRGGDLKEQVALCKEDSRHMRRLAALYDCSDEYEVIERCMFETGQCLPADSGTENASWSEDCSDAYPPSSDDCYVLTYVK